MHPSIVLLPFPMHGTLAMVAEPGMIEGKIDIMPAVIQCGCGLSISVSLRDGGRRER
jgi:hypothetical protein